MIRYIIELLERIILPYWLNRLLSDTALAILRPIAAVIGTISLISFIFFGFIWHLAQGNKASEYFNY